VPTRSDPLERLRAICLSLPDVTERPSHGSPAFYVRGKTTLVHVWVDGHHALAAQRREPLIALRLPPHGMHGEGEEWNASW